MPVERADDPPTALPGDPPEVPGGGGPVPSSNLGAPTTSLYPNVIGDATLQDSPYLAALKDLIGEVQSRDIRMMVIRPPIPARIYAMIPGEAQFDTTLQALLDRYGVELHNFSLVDNYEAFYFDSDHLNQMAS